MAKPRFPAIRLNSYPHLFPKDATIWNRFLDSHGKNYIGFDYDIKVGSGIEPPENATEADLRLIAGVYKKRIDAIGYTETQTHVFEVKPSATFSAIGQILGYAALYRQEFQQQPAVMPILVTDFETPDLRQFAKNSAVTLIIV